MGVLGTSSKANAAMLIDFDNLSFDGGTVTNLGGGNYSGSGIVFDTILLRDTTGGPGGTSITLAGLQCGVANSAGAAHTRRHVQAGFQHAGEHGHGDFADGSMEHRSGLSALYRRPWRAGCGNVRRLVLSGQFSTFNNFAGADGNLFIGVGFDMKDPEMFAFFGLPPNTGFTFLNTDIWLNANGQALWKQTWSTPWRSQSLLP